MNIRRIINSAKCGSTKEQYRLGMMYKNGDGILRNDSSAVNWLQKAADKGHGKAMYHLGLMYEEGRGVDKDDSIAVKYFLKAKEVLDAKKKDMGWTPIIAPIVSCVPVAFFSFFMIIFTFDDPEAANHASRPFFEKLIESSVIVVPFLIIASIISKLIGYQKTALSFALATMFWPLLLLASRFLLLGLWEFYKF